MRCMLPLRESSFERGASETMTDVKSSRSRLEERLILRSWEDEEFRRALLKDPRTIVARELTAMTGRPIELPRQMQIHIHEETPDDLHFILPHRRDEVAGDGQSLLVGWGKLLG
jgi:hypothetical protein